MKLENVIMKLRREGWEVTKRNFNDFAVEIEAEKAGHRKICCLVQQDQITSFKVENCLNSKLAQDSYKNAWVGSLDRAINISKIWQEN